VNYTLKTVDFHCRRTL